MTDSQTTAQERDQLLEPLRQQIDDVDVQLIALLNQRAQLAKDVGHIKDQHQMEVYDPARESAVLQRLQQRNDGPLSNQTIVHIFRQVIAACRNLEQRPAVAFLGPRGTFSHEAAYAGFGSEIDIAAKDGFSEVSEAVARGEVNFGVLPVENAIEGFVGTTFDLVVENNLAVIGEVVVPVKLHLVANCPLADIKVVYSHAQPLKQSRKWLRTNIPNAKPIPVESTGAAAVRAKDEACAAAIVGPMALEDGALPVLAGPIEDYPNNCTRFWKLGTQQSKDGDKSALMLVLPHQPGSLASALNVFAENKINLTQIYSRPVPTQPWEYRFFVEMSANAYEEPAATILRELAGSGAHVQILGVFDKADTPMHHVDDA